MSVLPRSAETMEAGRFPRRAFQRDPARAESIDDLRAIAMRRLPRFSAEYLEGGAEQELTLRRNREAFDRHVFRPRVLRNVDNRDLGRTVFGRRMALPIAISPTGFNGMLWHEADLCLARAAAAAGIPFSQSTVSNIRVGDIGAVPGLRHWWQLYVFGPDEVWRGLVARADAAGCEALLLTVDTHVLGNREWDRRNYARPLELSLRSKLDMLAHPTWFAQVLGRGLPRFLNLEEFVPEAQRGGFGIARWIGANQRESLDWDLVAEIRKAWPRKLVVKGIQNEEDVRLAVKAGVDGIVLSNHGGRQLDRAIAPIELVAAARAIAGPDFCILVDSGFRRGAEIVQAIALGADAVMLGRATLYGVAAGGEAGVARALAILRAEIDRTLGLLGVRSVDELGPGILFPSSG